jgi:hypothetical protein
VTISPLPHRTSLPARRRRVAVVALVALAGCGGGADHLLRPTVTTATPPTTPAATTSAAPAPVPALTSAATVLASATTLGGGAPDATTVARPAPSATPASTPAGAPESALVLTPAAFTDPMARGITAFSILVPRGWQVDGGVQWRPLFARAAQVQTHVEAPGVGVTLDWLPLEDFIYLQAPPGLSAPIGGTYQGKLFVPPITDPVQFVQSFWMPGVLTELQGAHVESVTPLPQIAEIVLQKAGGQGAAFTYRIRYDYSRNGQPWQRDVTFTLHFVGDPSTVASWYVYGASTEAAPAGQLDRYVPLLSAIVASRTTTPEWEATQTLVARIFYQGLRQEIANEAAFGRLLTQYEQQTAQLQQQIVADRQASEDHNAEVFRETLGGVQSYDDPVNGHPVELPLGYQTYWVNEKGEYLAADQASFDPNSLNDGTWQRLTPRP